MADLRFYERMAPRSVKALAEDLGAEFRGVEADRQIKDVAAIETATADDLGYAAGPKARALIEQSAAGAILVAPKDAQVKSAAALLLHPEPQRAFIAAVHLFYPAIARQESASGPIHPTAHIGAGVMIGHGCVVGPGASIGSGTEIGPNAVIGRGVQIGRHCQIGANCTITHALIGDRVRIQSGTVIGSDGFGFVPGPKGHLKIPQLGRVIIQDAVEFGANCTIDRGALGDTVIGEGTKLDNLVHIAHNCQIGRHCLLAAQIGIAGSTKIGDFVVFGGQVGVADHVEVGAGVMIAAKAGVSKDIPAGSIIAGYPARSVDHWRREVALLSLMVKKRANREKPKP